MLLNGIQKRHPGPRWCKVDRLPLVHDLCRACHGLGHGGEQLFREGHDVRVVCVGLIDLQHGEFGVVGAVDPFVAEIPAELVHPLQPAHDQALEIQLVRYPQIQAHVQRVVVCDKRSRRGPAVKRLQHRCVHLQKAAVIQETPYSLHHGRPLAKGLLDIGIESQVQVPLSVPEFLVAEGIVHQQLAVPGFFLGHRQGSHGLGQEFEALHLNRLLAGPGEKDRPVHAHEVTDVQQLPHLEGLVAHHILPHVDLDPARRVTQIGKRALAVVANHHQPPGQRDVLLRFLKRIEPLQDFGRVVGDLEPVGIGRDPHLFQSRQLLHPLCD